MGPGELGQLLSELLLSPTDLDAQLPQPGTPGGWLSGQGREPPFTVAGQLAELAVIALGSGRLA